MAFDHWNTPEFIVTRLKRIAPITLDPCSNKTSIVAAKTNIRPPKDGLTVKWSGFTYVNPPFSDILSWVEKGVNSVFSPRGLKHLVYMLPCSPETQYYKMIWSTQPMDQMDENNDSDIGTVIGMAQSRFGFLHPKRKKKLNGPSMSNTLVYIGYNPQWFINAFDDTLTFITNWSYPADQNRTR